MTSAESVQRSEIGVFIAFERLLDTVQLSLLPEAELDYRMGQVYWLVQYPQDLLIIMSRHNEIPWDSIDTDSPLQSTPFILSKRLSCLINNLPNIVFI